METRKKNTESKQPETKKSKRYLRCNFTDPEKLEIAKRMAEAKNRLDALEGDKKRVVKDFDAKIATEESNLSVESSKINSGYEFRNVECTEHFDQPKAGKKRVIREDTQDEVGVEDMTDDDKQRELIETPVK